MSYFFFHHAILDSKLSVNSLDTSIHKITAALPLQTISNIIGTSNQFKNQYKCIHNHTIKNTLQNTSCLFNVIFLFVITQTINHIINHRRINIICSIVICYLVILYPFPQATHPQILTQR
jgi:spore maturation protein SpmB